MNKFSKWISTGFDQPKYLQYLTQTFLEHVYRYGLESKRKDVLIDSILKSGMSFESIANMLDSNDFPHEYFSEMIETHEYDDIYNSLSYVWVGEKMNLSLCRFLLNFSALLTDLYTSICVFNKKSNNTNTLSILYYGNAHSHNLKKLLTNFGYIIKPQFKIPKFDNSTEDRCIDLEKAGFYFDVEEFLQR